MIRSVCLVVAATMGVALSAQAQQPADSADVLVFSGAFTTGTREFVRVFLQKGQVYRAEINVGTVSFTLRPRHAGGETPTTVLLRGGAASGESVYEIYPFKDDEYEVKVEDFPAGETATLNIYRDIHASRRRSGIANRTGPKWTMGLEFGAGYHGNHAGTDFEACVLISGERALSGCALGLNLDDSDESSRIVWFFVEPRLRVVGSKSGVRPELGILVRGGFGSSETVALYSPTMLAPGAYLRIWLGSARGKGLGIGLSAFHATLFGRGTDNQSFDHISATLSFSF